MLNPHQKTTKTMTVNKKFTKYKQISLKAPAVLNLFYTTGKYVELCT